VQPPPPLRADPWPEFGMIFLRVTIYSAPHLRGHPTLPPATSPLTVFSWWRRYCLFRGPYVTSFSPSVVHSSSVLMAIPDRVRWVTVDVEHYLVILVGMVRG